jgi:transposase
MADGKPQRLADMVVKRLRDGRRRFDAQAKRELVEACLRPGVSVAGLALTHGVNANLLRKWISRHQRGLGQGPSTAAVVATAPPAFIPVVVSGAAERSEYRLRATLRNGVEVDCGVTSSDALPRLLQLLDRLPCSGSKRG